MDTFARAARRLAQRFDLVGQKIAATIEQVCCEEPASRRTNARR
jgi:hypothetical protein